MQICKFHAHHKLAQLYWNRGLIFWQSPTSTLPPPCIWHKYGNRHTFPKPTANPIQLKIYWNLLSHFGLPSSLGTSGGMSIGKSSSTKYLWLSSPFPYKWEDSSKRVSAAGFMGNDRRVSPKKAVLCFCVMQRNVSLEVPQFKYQTRNYYYIDRVTTLDVLQFLL